jgi:hypothetical protein
VEQDGCARPGGRLNLARRRQASKNRDAGSNRMVRLRMASASIVWVLPAVVPPEISGLGPASMMCTAFGLAKVPWPSSRSAGRGRDVT